MNRKWVVLFVCTVLGLAFVASAMMPGLDIILECPGCEKPVSQMTLLSGNTFGARYWTDRKIEAPMMLDIPWLVKCPECAFLFWADEAEELGRGSYERRCMYGESLVGCQWTNVPSLNIPLEDKDAVVHEIPEKIFTPSIVISDEVEVEAE